MVNMFFMFFSRTHTPYIHTRTYTHPHTSPHTFIQTHTHTSKIISSTLSPRDYVDVKITK